MGIFDSPTDRRNFIRKSLALIPAVSIAPLAMASEASSRARSEGSPAVQPAPATPAPETSAQALADEAQAATGSSPYHPLYFTAEEWAFLGAACERLIPSDAEGPGALELCVPDFIDRQMMGSFGHASRWYMMGPFFEGPPELGPQSRLTPREVYRTGIAATDTYCRSMPGGARFVELSVEEQDTLLKGLEKGSISFPDSDSKDFFKLLLQNTQEGYLADPVHGGNKDMGSWKMIGFPGARADFNDWVDRPGVVYPLGPVSVIGGRT